MKPFRRGRFEDLPERPRVPHPYFDTEVTELIVRSPHFRDPKIHVREWGSGPPLLLIHGFMTSSYSFRHVLEPLGRHHRLLIPDLPGAGRSDKPDVSYDAPSLARFVVELVDALGVRGCVALGNSLGGYLSMRAVLHDPGVFSRLVNVHSPGLPELRLSALGALVKVPGTRALTAYLARRSPLRWVHRNVHYYDESLKSLEEAREYGTPLSTAEGSWAFSRMLAEVLRPRDLAEFEQALAARRDRGLGFPIPLQLIYAEQDPMVPPAIGKRLSALVPDAEVHWLGETSHFTHVDSPERLVPLVSRFFSA